jgi:hypothetical protein
MMILFNISHITGRAKELSQRGVLTPHCNTLKHPQPLHLQSIMRPVDRRNHSTACIVVSSALQHMLTSISSVSHYWTCPVSYISSQQLPTSGSKALRQDHAGSWPRCYLRGSSDTWQNSCIGLDFGVGSCEGLPRAKACDACQAIASSYYICCGCSQRLIGSAVEGAG